MARSEVISRVANTLVQISPQHSLRVAIDGITAVGKMTFADKLAEDVRARATVRSSFNGRFSPTQCGALQPGTRLRRGLLRERLRLRCASFGAPPPPWADGQRFLSLRGLRPCYRPADRCSNTEFRSRSDRHRRRQFPPTTRARQRMGRRRVPYTASFASARARGVARDAPRLGSIKDALRLYDTRYDPAQRRYLSEVDPETTADVVVDHDDPQSPSIVRIAADLGLVEAHLRRTRAFFGPRAEKWEKRFPDDGAAYRDAIAELGPKRGGVVVDLGCGTGRALPFLRSAIGVEGVVVGVDVTPEMLQAACHEGRDHDAQLVLADVMRLPILAESVDSFFVAGLLSHVPDSHHLLRSMARAAKPTGRLALFSPVGRAEQAHRRNRVLRPDEVLDPQVLPGLLAATGWTVKRIDDCEQRYLALASKAT